MSFDLDRLRRAVEAQGKVARIVVASAQGSVPRGVGTAMLVWPGGQAGTIGGGALEFEAVARARAASRDRLDKVPLGPGLGQCCGGAVTLLTEIWDAARLATLTGGHVARALPGHAEAAMPLQVEAAIRRARSGAAPLVPQMLQGWFIEPVKPPALPLWIWGAGHVGRALVEVLAPLPQFAITWVDDAAERFPGHVPEGVRVLPAPQMPGAMAMAPGDAQHLILTYSHEIDLALCHAALSHGFGACGVIGSATKWARFGKRLEALGHGRAAIARITCPIGDPRLGKHPQAIAVGVAAGLLRGMERGQTRARDGETMQIGQNR